MSSEAELVTFQKFRVFIIFVTSLFLLALGLFGSVADPLYASEIDLFGYFRNELTAAHLSNDANLVLQNKLRLDFEWDMAKGLFLAGNLNLIHYAGDTKGTFLDNMPGAISGIVPEPFRSFFEYQMDNDIDVDNLFLRIRMPSLDLTVGKQQVSFGTGYAWNPTDLFNRKSLIDPTEEKPGHEALRIDYPLSLSSRILVILDGEDSLEDPGFIVRYKTNIGHFDYSLSYGRRASSKTDYDLLEVIDETREMTGFDLVGELFGLGVWFEGAWNRMEKSEDFGEWVLGVDYTWEKGFYMLLEYFHSDLGEVSKRNYTLNSWMRYLAGETRSISKDNIYLYGNYPATDLLNVGLSFLHSLSDGSVALVPMIEYSILEDLDLEFFGGINLGSEGTVYSEELGNGMMLRLTWYF